MLEDITVSDLLQLQVITSYKYFEPKNICCIENRMRIHFCVHLRIKFHMPSSNCSIVIGIKPKAKLRFNVTAPLLFHTLNEKGNERKKLLTSYDGLITIYSRRQMLHCLPPWRSIVLTSCFKQMINNSLWSQIALAL